MSEITHDAMKKRIAELEIAHDEWKDMSLKLAAELYSRFGTERPPFLPALFENERKKLRSYDSKTARIEELEAALHRISLGSQDSGTTKESLGREARAALAGEKQ